MNLFIPAIESVAITLGIGILGFWTISKKIVPGDALRMLTPLATDISLPCLIFVTIVFRFNPGQSPMWFMLPFWWIGFTIVVGLLSGMARFLSNKSYRREFFVSLFYQNGIFFPLSLLSGIYSGESHYLVYLFLFTLFYPAFFFNTVHLFFGKYDRRITIRRLMNPIFIATLMAVLIRVLGIQDSIPEFILSMLNIVGKMAIPILLMIIGGNIYIDFQKKGTLHMLEVAKFLIFKNILFPFIILFLLVIIRPPYEIALILLLEASVPPITAVPIVTERDGGDRAIVNQFLVASFFFSLITIPVMVSLFSMYFNSP